MHFTPTYSSWLNQVENWFGRIQRDVIARGIFTSTSDLHKKLMRYIRQYNKMPNHSSGSTPIRPDDSYPVQFFWFNGLETMGIILREDHELEYIKKILPRWDRTFPRNYRIAVQMNDSVKKVLRTAPGWNPPTVLFRFVDSALNLSEPRMDGF
jgi:hypothetical protein